MPQTMKQKREKAIAGYRRAIDRRTPQLTSPRWGDIARNKITKLQYLVLSTHKRLTNAN